MARGSVVFWRERLRNVMPLAEPCQLDTRGSGNLALTTSGLRRSQINAPNGRG